jgi:hypothetical protein
MSILLNTFFFLNLLSFPFFLKFLSISIYQGVLFVLFLLLLFYGLILNKNRISPFSKEIDKSLKLSVTLYIIYVFYTIVLSCYYCVISGNLISFLDIIRVAVKVISIIVFSYYLSMQNLIRLMNRYSDLMMIASLAGILLVILTTFKLISPIGYFDIPDVGDFDLYRTRRQIYLLGFNWTSIPLPGGLSIIRLQSFCDEPGTFAFALLISIIWSAFYLRKTAYIVLMTIALFLTWSVGGILLIVPILFYFLYTNFSKLPILAKSLIIVFILVIISFAIYIQNSEYLSSILDYTSTKYSSVRTNETSVGDRLDSLNIIFGKILLHPEGFGLNSTNRDMGVRLSVGWFAPLIESGFLGFSIYIFAFGIILISCFKSIFGKQKKIVIAFSLCIMVNAVAAFQRSSIDGSFFNMFIIMGYLKSSNENFPESIPIKILK